MGDVDASISQPFPLLSDPNRAMRSRIGVLVERRYLRQAQPAGMIATLHAYGCDVTLIDPDVALYEAGCNSWLDGLDLVVTRGRSWGVFNLLAWAELQGIPTINCQAAIAAVHNKVVMGIRLTAGGLPTPRTVFGSIARLAQQLTDTDYPLILKPMFGDNCQGIQVIESRDELNAIQLKETVVLAQPYLPSDGYDLKLYGIGEDIWAVRKPSPLSSRGASPGQLTSSQPAELIPVTSMLQNLGRQCSRLFGLELYGVDCLETGNGPVVIEVNEFPNYTSVPQASERLADYVLRREF